MKQGTRKENILGVSLTDDLFVKIKALRVPK
jgi:hypothetical protein